MGDRGRNLTHDSRKDVVFWVGLGCVGSWLIGIDSVEQAALYHEPSLLSETDDIQ